LPGKLVRSESEGKTGDAAADEAYDGAGHTYDFYFDEFKRNSLDDNGMTLTSSVHVAEADGTALNNAFWNGEQMAYGDGDGQIFKRFTASLEIIGHELTHGVESFTSNLEYRGEPGALNEHFADVFGVLVRQWKEGETALKANWVIGAEIFAKPGPNRRGIRDMENPGTAYDDPVLGKDPQPADYDHRYKGTADRGGVHINSGIANRAFVLFAKTLKGKAWEAAGQIWYKTMVNLTTRSNFKDCARMSVQEAEQDSAAAGKSARAAWKKVGISV
jgi:Zn-dependent metalloprotease